MLNSLLESALASSPGSSNPLASWLLLAQSATEEELQALLESQPQEAITALEAALRSQGGEALEPRTNKYLEAYRKREPRFPSGPQRAFLCLDHVEHVLYGGAAGGGKSSAGLAAALQYVDVPGYAALVLRATFADLSKPGALIPRSHEWLQGSGAKWRERDMQWTFPEGGSLSFGHLEEPRAHLAYQGAEYQCVVFEEAGQLRPEQMQYLHSRVRRPSTTLESAKSYHLGTVPLRHRYTANPGDRAHEWLVAKFMLAQDPNWRFIPALARDNPGLDVKDYTKRLAAISDPVLRRQLKDGDWSAVDRSGLVVPEFTEAVEAAVVREHVRPPYFVPQVAVDTGSKDLTVYLFAYVDFLSGLLVVEAEEVFRDPSTREMGEKVVAMEAQLWGPARAAGTALPAVRKADGDGRYMRDMAEHPYKLVFTVTEKQDALHAQRKCRADLVEGKIVINPRCKHLIRTLKHARKKENGEWDRTKELGHADAWAALVYLHRNALWDRNPYPPMVASRLMPGTFVPAKPQPTLPNRAAEIAASYGFHMGPQR